MMSTSDKTTSPSSTICSTSREERLQLCLCIDDGEHDGAVVREMQRLILVHSTVRSVAEYAAIYRDTRDVVGSHGLDECLVKWLVSPAICFADVDSHQLRLTLDL